MATDYFSAAKSRAKNLSKEIEEKRGHLGLGKSIASYGQQTAGRSMSKKKSNIIRWQNVPIQTRAALGPGLRFRDPGDPKSVMERARSKAMRFESTLTKVKERDSKHRNTAHFGSMDASEGGNTKAGSAWLQSLRGKSERRKGLRSIGSSPVNLGFSARTAEGAGKASPSATGRKKVFAKRFDKKSIDRTRDR